MRIVAFIITCGIASIAQAQTQQSRVLAKDAWDLWINGASRLKVTESLITATGDIITQHANGPMLSNSDGTSATVPTLRPNRATTTGFSAPTNSLEFIISGVKRATLTTTQLLLQSTNILTVRNRIINDVGPLTLGFIITTSNYGLGLNDVLTGGSFEVDGSLYADGGIKLTGAMDIPESSEPTAPATNGARLFTRDDGAGKTQLCVRFATGTSQCFATEP